MVLLRLAFAMFALSGLALCVWLSKISIAAAYAGIVTYAIAAIGVIVYIARREQRAVSQFAPSAEPVRPSSPHAHVGEGQ